MKAIGSIVLLTLLLTITVCRAENFNSSKWLLQYQGRTANDVINDTRSKKLFKTLVPEYSADFGFRKNDKAISLVAALKTVLSVSADKVTSNGTVVSMWGCRLHSCDEKGYFEVDTTTEASALAIVHYVFQKEYNKSPQLFLAANKYDCQNFPEETKQRIAQWLQNVRVQVDVVRCLEHDQIAIIEHWN